MTSTTPKTEMERRAIVPDAVVMELYQKMLTVFYVEERLKVFDRLGKVSFHASARGHEKLQIGMTLLLKPRQDWFFTYYREKGIAIGLGMSLKDIFLGMLSRQSDPNSVGRNMPEHWSSRELRLVAQTAATGTQFLPAVGLARAVKRDGGDEIVYVSSGEGATSEGEFFEALNWASRERLPVLFVIQNNGYAISVPQAGADEFRDSPHSPGIRDANAIPIDGTWFEPMYQMLPPVIEMMRQGKWTGSGRRTSHPHGLTLLLRRPEEVPKPGRIERNDRARPDPSNRTLLATPSDPRRRANAADARANESGSRSSRG